ncbi:MAG: PAAR-like protein [Gammaproteobacteria bacterium]
MSPTNPAFVSATAAAMGVPTPVPCIPATVAPWVTGSPTVMLGNVPALNNTSMLTCALGAPNCIFIMVPGEVTEQIP